MEQELGFEINYKKVTVKMADGLVYTGKVNIHNCSRLSDFFRNTNDRFLVAITEPDETEKVMFLNKNFILWAETTD